MVRQKLGFASSGKGAGEGFDGGAARSLAWHSWMASLDEKCSLALREDPEPVLSSLKGKARC